MKQRIIDDRRWPDVDGEVTKLHFQQLRFIEHAIQAEAAAKEACTLESIVRSNSHVAWLLFAVQRG